jgi:hypothetical protein
MAERAADLSCRPTRLTVLPAASRQKFRGMGECYLKGVRPSARGSCSPKVLQVASYGMKRL